MITHYQPSLTTIHRPELTTIIMGSRPFLRNLNHHYPSFIKASWPRATKRPRHVSLPPAGAVLVVAASRSDAPGTSRPMWGWRQARRSRGPCGHGGPRGVKSWRIVYGLQPVMDYTLW